MLLFGEFWNVCTPSFHEVGTTYMQQKVILNPTYYRPFGATSDIGGAQCTPPISYACSTCAIVMKLSEIKQLDK